ncbi:MAG TPA: galactitol-1-phosphate 5-dehydrogenase [Bryobacteraceae bacterium]|nr:galactitol-1-phosphate 5-dehydrogenase [Bryobacteraceae bacterium]
MKALVLKQYKELELAEMPVPEIGPEELLVRVKACGICGSDVHGFDGSTGRRIPPIVMGHEAAGVVAETGRAVEGFRAGDRVTFDSTIWCGKCFFCRRGEVNLCDNRQVLGVSPGEYRRHGAFAEYVAVPQHISYKLPDELSFEHAAMIEAVSVAVHAVAITPVKLEDTAVVVGSGMIGLLAVQALKRAGCGRVIAVDVDDTRLKLAGQLGADRQINSKASDVAALVRDETGGRGADVALEAVGATEPLQTALASLRKGGNLTLVGNVSPKVELPLQSVVTRQIRVNGSCASSGEYPACISLLARCAIQVAPLISATAPLEDGAGWFSRLYNREPNLMKVILQP